MDVAPFVSIAAAALVCGSACTTEPAVPIGADIRCARDAECPDRFVCKAGACVSIRENQPPRLGVEPVSRTDGPIELWVVISDAEADPVDVTLEARPRPEADFAPIDWVGATGLAANPNPSRIRLEWAMAAADLSRLGCPGYCGAIALRLTPRDPFGPGAAVVLDGVEHGNDPPVLAAAALDDALVRRNAVLRFLVRDSAGDPVDVTRFEVSRSGAFDAADPSDIVVVPLTGGAGGSFPGGILGRLATTPEGVEHNITWDSTVGAGYDAPGAALRLQVAESSGAAASQPFTVGPFRVDNIESAPELYVRTLTDLAQPVLEPVQLEVQIVDGDSDRCLLLVQYSLDGARWTPAASSDRFVDLESAPTLAAAPAHLFTWDISQLGAGVFDPVHLRLEARDGRGADVEALPTFVVDTSRARPVDRSPPNYIAPVGAVYTQPTVLLQWTARLGAERYYVEVARDPAFAQLVATIDSELTALSFEALEDIAYYWRVRADVTPPGQYSSLGGAPAAFYRLGDSLYVHCAADDTTGCSNAGRVGNRSLPFKRIDTALAQAADNGIATVRVASRGGAAGYPGTIHLRDGVSLLGGYDATFAESVRDVVGGRTVLTGGVSLPYGAAGVVAEDIQRPTLLSGFDVRSPASALSFGLRAVGVQEAMVIEDCTFTAGAASDTSIAIELVSSRPDLKRLDVRGGQAESLAVGIGASLGSLLVLEDSVVVAGAAGVKSIGISVAQSEAILTNVDVGGGSGTPLEAIGVDARSSRLEITSSSVSAGVASSASKAVDARVSELTAVGSTLVAGASGGAALGLDVRMGTTVVDRVTIGTGPAPMTFGVRVDAAPSLTINASSVSCGPAEADARGLSAFDAPVAVQRSEIASAAAATSIAVELQSAPTNPASSVAGCRIRSGDGSTYSAGVKIDTGTYRLADNQILSGAAPGGVSVGIAVDAGTAQVITRSIIGSGDAVTTMALELRGNGASVEDTILFTGSGAEWCIREATAGVSASLLRPLTADCDGSYYRDENSTVMDLCCGNGNYARSVCPGPTSLSPPAVDCRAAPTAAEVFVPSFVRTDFETWIIRAGGRADIAPPSGWSSGDLGVHPSMTGVPPP